MKKLTHNQFLERLGKIDYEVIGIYQDINTKIIIKDIHGEYLMTPESLLTGRKPSLKSAIDKNIFFKNKSKVLHSKKYSYIKTVYVDAKSKVTIICPKHGDFRQTPSNHLQGRGCLKCSDNAKEFSEITNDEFILKAKILHGDKYEYSECVYFRANTKVIIYCPKHGNFNQSPNSHLRGSGCPKCNNEKSGWQKSKFIDRGQGKECTFYILKCFNREEKFYKIGICSTSIKQRYRRLKDMPYSYEIIKETKGEPGDIWDLELKTKRELKHHHYSPKIKFAGSKTECFSQINVNL